MIIYKLLQLLNDVMMSIRKWLVRHNMWLDLNWLRQRRRSCRGKKGRVLNKGCILDVDTIHYIFLWGFNFAHKKKAETAMLWFIILYMTELRIYMSNKTGFSLIIISYRQMKQERKELNTDLRWLLYCDSFYKCL